MDVLISWAYLDEAEAYLGALTKSKKADRAEIAVPELLEYQKRMETPPKQLPDALNNDLLAIRIVVPAEGDVNTFRLAKRMPGDAQLPPALAARSYMLSRYQNEWNSKQRQVRFVGLPGLSQFLEHWALSCAALGVPLPPSLWRETPCFELPSTMQLVKLLGACAHNEKLGSKRPFASLAEEWSLPGRSADLDSMVLMSLARRLGIQQEPSDG